MMRLILHAGTHKTGSSAIQHSLWQNRALLATAGINYPDPREGFGGTHTGHHPWVHAVQREDPGDLATLREAIDTARVTADPDGVVLLSAEPVYRHVLRSAPVRGWWRKHRAYLEALHGELGRGGFEIIPALVFRRRDTFLESLYHERVAGGFGRPFPDYLNSPDRLLDYERQLSVFAAVFGNVRSVQYETIAGPRIVDRFLGWLGFAAPALPSEERVRQSVDTRLTLWMAAAYRDDDREELVTQRRRFSKNPTSDEVFEDTRPRTLWTDEERRRELLASYGDHEPIVDDREPAVLTPSLEDRIDDAFDAYLVAKGLEPTNRRARRRAES